MKKRLLVTLTALLIICYTHAQEVGAWQVIVTDTSKTEDELYRSMLVTFIENGFEIEKKDDLFRTVLFEPARYEYTASRRTTWRYIIVEAKIKDSKITVTAKDKRRGQAKVPTIYDPDYPETVQAFNLIKILLKNISSDISYAIDPNYQQKDKGGKFQDDVYGPRRRN